MGTANELECWNAGIVASWVLEQWHDGSSEKRNKTQIAVHNIYEIEIVAMRLWIHSRSGSQKLFLKILCHADTPLRGSGDQGWLKVIFDPVLEKFGYLRKRRLTGK